jgi:replicative DNA helicase
VTAAAPARTVPHNLEAEQSLLGAMLLSREAIAVAIETVRDEEFYRPAHGHIYTAILDLYAQGEAVDPITVADELGRAGLLAEVGGLPGLLDLQGNTPAISTAARYARIVHEHATLRELITVSSSIAEIGYAHPTDVEAAVDEAETLVFAVADRRSRDSIAPLHELLSDGIDDLGLLYERGQAVTGVPTGFVELDERLLGLQPSSLYILGARPSMGKTAMALNIAVHAAVEGNVPVLMFSLEMGRKELTKRVLSSEARVDSTRLRNGSLLEQDWGKISHSLGRLSEGALYIDDDPALTLMGIRGKARRVKSRAGGLGLIVIDYLQLMQGRQKAENRQVEISEISRGLKILARELEVPVIALSQLSRNLENRADKRPMLADLRESGSLEQDSDVVLFIYRDEVYNAESADHGVAEVIIAKQRNGPTGVIRLAFLDQYTRFANMARGL